MRVFVAGATGAIGRPLVPRLVEAGHDVVGMTRSPAKADGLRDAGAEPVVADALDADGLRDAVVKAHPEVVVHQLTAIPAALDPRKMAEQFALTNRLRSEGTRNLVAGAQAAGARRVVAQSVAFAYPPGEGLAGEEEPLNLDVPGRFRPTIGAVYDLETAVLGAEGLEGLVLRYGYFYGPGTSYASDGATAEQVRRRRFPLVGKATGVSSFIHIDDAARATVAAVEGWPPGACNVVDDDPAPVAEWLPAYADALGAKRPRRVPAWLARRFVGEWAINFMLRARGASNARALERGFQPEHPSWRQGFVEALG